MRTRRVVILSCHSLLAAGVQCLLEEFGEVALSIVQADAPDWTTQSKDIAPHAIVIDCSDACLEPGIISKLLEEHSQAKVVALGLNSQGIDVYQRRRVPQTDVNGLLEAILGRHGARETREQAAQP